MAMIIKTRQPGYYGDSKPDFCPPAFWRGITGDTVYNRTSILPMVRRRLELAGQANTWKRRPVDPLI